VFCVLHSQGMQSVGVPLQDSNGLVRLWAHEAMRVFHDRLVDDADRGWFSALVSDMLEKHTGLVFGDVFTLDADTPPSPASPSRLKAAASEADADIVRKQQAAAAALRNVLFADFLQSGGSDAAKYQEASDVSKLLKRVEDSLEDYNEQVRLIRRGWLQ